MKRVFMTAALCVAMIAPSHRMAGAAETWYEIKSPGFTVWANANDGGTRTLVWQLEQVRHVARSLWPWMKVDLPKPLVVLALKDEQGMKLMAPSYWEVKGGVRPGSVWVTAPDQHYIAIRTDMQSRDNVMVNPHSSAYFSYAHLILTSSFDSTPPLWLTRGLAGVWSNTLVRREDVIVGAVIPWHLEALRERRVPLRQMMAATRQSSVFRNNEEMRYFDAQSWAFVHYLMFGDKGVNADKLNAFITSLMKDQTPDAAFAASIGSIDEYERVFANYVDRSLFSAIRVKVDMNLDRERLQARPMTAVESAVARASFHTAMRRPAEARALLDEARKLDPQSANAQAVEAMVLDFAGDPEAAKAAYANAASLGTTNSYALYRSAMLSWRGADESTQQQIEIRLARAVELNPLFAAAHAALAEARAMLKRPSPTIISHMQKAVSLEPSEPWHRIVASRVLLRLNAREEARKAAEGALKLAADDEPARREAERILSMLGQK